jgi:hypothetical protein
MYFVFVVCLYVKLGIFTGHFLKEEGGSVV